MRVIFLFLLRGVCLDVGFTYEPDPLRIDHYRRDLTIVSPPTLLFLPFSSLFRLYTNIIRIPLRTRLVLSCLVTSRFFFSVFRAYFRPRSVFFFSHLTYTRLSKKERKKRRYDEPLIPPFEIPLFLLCYLPSLSPMICYVVSLFFEWNLLFSGAHLFFFYVTATVISPSYPEEVLSKTRKGTPVPR